MLAEITRFVNWVRRRNPQARTHKDYRYDLKQFVAVVGERPPATITFQDIDRFVNFQVSRGLKATTINRRLAAITSLYTFLAAEDETLACPVLSGRHFLREPQPLPRPVQQEDLRKFFQVIDHTRDRAMFLLMLRGGLRIAEVAGMLLNDLFLAETRPRLVVRGKNGKERSVYLSRQAEGALLSWLAERPEVASDYVFLSYLGKGLSTTAIHLRLMRYRELAGVN